MLVAILTPEMKDIIQAFSAGSVATVNDDGTPAVSPKATFIVIDDDRLAFGDVRSPATIANLRARPAVEVLFTDVLARKSVRVAGTAEVVPTTHEIRPLFEEWTDYVPFMRGFVLITLTSASVIHSPAYDQGFTEAELIETNLAKLTARSHSS